MTETEQRYAQIEKQALALAWACERPSQYLIGSKFVLETDHKPLIPLLSLKNLEDLPIRVQRFRLRMMRYNYNIVHVPGKELLTADYLSREPLHETGTEDLREEVQAYVQHIWTNLPASDPRITRIKDLQDKNWVIISWKQQVMGGKRRNKLNRYSDLSVDEGLLMKGNRIVIPQALQAEILEKLHTGHQGLVKCKERARIAVWWPGINSDLETFVKKCRIRCQFQQPKFEPMYASELPSHPWQKVGKDLFMWKQHKYLLVVDYYSRFIEIAKLSCMTSEEVITHLKSIFARHGIPQYVISENGTQYSSQLFSDFAKRYGFRHITSSPRYPQTNGEANRVVQTIKKLLDKSSDPHLALLLYRVTPLQLGYSPAELLMGRNLRSTVPMALNQLIPRTTDKKFVKARDQKLKESQRKNYNRRHRTRKQNLLEMGDVVWITDLARQGSIIQEKTPRSYTIQTSNGIIRRNQRSLNRLPDQDTDQDVTYDNQDSEYETVQMEQNDSDSHHDSRDTREVRRSTRQRHSPDRYGVWLN